LQPGDGSLTRLFKLKRTGLWQSPPIDREHNPGGEKKAVRRQTATSGINPAGSSRAERLDPLSLPVSFNAHDVRADGGIRQIEIHRERVVLRRAVQGMRMAVNVRVSDFLGVAIRDVKDSQMLVLLHRDPSLTIPLCVSEDQDEIADAWLMWSELFALPQLDDDAREPTSRRRRRNAIRARRPKFLMRRRIGALLNPANMFRGEREIIARD
jgi:uncharacterized protein DUF6101